MQTKLAYQIKVAESERAASQTTNWKQIMSGIVFITVSIMTAALSVDITPLILLPVGISLIRTDEDVVV